MMRNTGRARRTAGSRRSSAWAGVALAVALVLATLVVTGPEAIGPTTGDAESRRASVERATPRPTPAATLPAVGVASAVERLAATTAPALDDDEDATAPRRARPGSTAAFRDDFRRLATSRGPAALADAVSAVMTTPLPDAAKVAGLQVMLETGHPAAHDLLAQALVAPGAATARGRASLADWAAARLAEAAAEEPRARELLAAVVDGTIPSSDAALRRRAATALARWGGDEDIDLLASATFARADPLLDASVRSGLERRADAELWRARLPGLMGPAPAPPPVSGDVSHHSDDSHQEP